MRKACLILTEPKKGHEADLIAAIAQGDMAAFRALHSKYHGSVFGFAMRLVRAPDRADEITNDTMLAVWKGAKSFQGRSKVSTWIFGITYRIAMKTVRRNRHERGHVDIHDGPELADEGPDAVEVLFNRQQVSKALATLSVDLRAVVELTYYYGLSYPEISEVLNCPVGTVKSRMHAAREALRKVLS